MIKLLCSTFLRKSAALYALASLIYLPVSIYAGYFDQLTPIKLLQIIFFTGDFYHLWYLPGVIIGMGLVYLLSRRLSFSWISAISLILYLIGILGDSYFGLVEQVPWLAAGYQGSPGAVRLYPQRALLCFRFSW